MRKNNKKFVNEEWVNEELIMPSFVWGFGDMFLLFNLLVPAFSAGKERLPDLGCLVFFLFGSFCLVANRGLDYGIGVV